jgi:hypothetical protein
MTASDRAPLDSRGEQINARAKELWEADGKPEGRDRAYWDQAAKLIAEEERAAAKTQNAPTARGAQETDDPIGVTLAAMNRKN